MTLTKQCFRTMKLKARKISGDSDLGKRMLLKWTLNTWWRFGLDLFGP